GGAWAGDPHRLGSWSRHDGRGLSGRAAQASVRLRAPRHRRCRADTTDATDRARARRRADCVGVPRGARDDKSTARPGEDEDPRRRHQVEVPDLGELPSRVAAVLEAIYAAFGSGWDDVAGADPRRRGLADEAIWLGRLVTRLLPSEPEALGLLALMLHCDARRAARRDDDGRYVPLDQQDI